MKTKIKIYEGEEMNRSLKEIEEDITNLCPNKSMFELLDEYRLAFDKEIIQESYKIINLNPQEIYFLIVSKIRLFKEKFLEDPKIIIINNIYLNALKKSTNFNFIDSNINKIWERLNGHK